MSNKHDGQALPAISEANPGRGTSARVAFAGPERTWEDQADALDSLASVLQSRGMKLERMQERLELENGLILRPQIVGVQPRDDGAVRTATTIEVNHPVLCPAGTFEYQHSIGSTVGDSFEKGFASWADTDLPVFADALRQQLKDCTALLLDSPASAAATPGRRQIILGPPLHVVARQAQDSGGAHDFCPCCLLTNCFEAFRAFMERDTFCGVRLFAARSDGEPQADCRINGVDWAPGRRRAAQVRRDMA